MKNKILQKDLHQKNQIWLKQEIKEEMLNKNHHLNQSLEGNQILHQQNQLFLQQHLLLLQLQQLLRILNEMFLFFYIIYIK